MLSDHRVADGAKMIARGELWIVDQILEVMHGSNLDCRGLQHPDNLLARQSARPRLDVLLDDVDLIEPTGERVESPVHTPARRTDGRPKRFPFIVVVHGNRHPTVIVGTLSSAAKYSVW